MEFLAPWWAALAAAAAVPLLIHLMRRRIGTRVAFPAVRYLLRAEQEQSARLRLQNWLLMALRVLAVLLLALAAARPAARVGGAGHAPAAVAIVLDNSLSTSVVVNGQPLFNTLRDAAAGVVGDATDADRLWLVTADGHVVGSDRAAVRAALGTVAPLAGAGDLPRGVARAAAVVRSAGPTLAPSVVVLTDGQATAWRAAPSLGTVGRTRIVVFAPPSSPPPNRGVVLAEPSPRRWAGAGTLVARVASRDSVPYRIVERANGAERTLLRGTAPPDAELRPRLATLTRGWLAGSMSVQPDELRGDDERHFAAFVGDAPAAVADPSAGPFAASGLATLAQSGRIRASPSPGAEPVAVVSADLAQRLPAMLVAPTDAARLGAANLALERLGVPWRFGPLRTGESAVRFAATPDSTRVGVVATRRFQLVPRGNSSADTLATAGGEPWAVAGANYVLLASPLVPDATSLPLRAAFIPWLGETLNERLGGAPVTIVAAPPNAAITIPDGADALATPDGRRLALTAGAATAPDRPGVYFWLRNGARVGALVVNVEAEESELARMNVRTLAGRVGGGGATQIAATARDAAAASYGGEGERPIGAPLLVAALVALLAEGLATRPRAAVARAAAP